MLSEFPVYEPITEWKLHLEQSGGQTVVDPTKGQLIIIPRCSKKKQSEGFDWSIRTPQEAFIMNMHSDTEDLRVYEDLRGALENWLPRWVTHFEVRRFARLQMGYVNIITAEKMPLFSPRAGYIDIDRILKVFVNIPGVHKSLVPPAEKSYQSRALIFLSVRPRPSHGRRLKHYRLLGRRPG